MNKKSALSLLFVLFLILNQVAFAETNKDETRSDDFRIELPKIIISDIPSEITIHYQSDGDSVLVKLNQTEMWHKADTDKIVVPFVFKGNDRIQVSISEQSRAVNYSAIPLWMSILPPLIAILMALVFKEVFSALFVGLFTGTLIIFTYQDISFFTAFFKAIFAISDTYIIQSLADTGHISIIVFSMLIGAMVNLITQNGGMQGVVNKLSRFANSSRSGQIVTWILGVLIFFDDYANTLVVGNTMRPVTDRLKISREKLAYIVDSTAAPVASIAMITTWIGIELSYIQSATVQINIDESAYSIFLNSLPTRFYPFFTLFFILMIVIMKRDFGPMYKAEQRAKSEEKISEVKQKNNDEVESIEISDEIPTRWYNAGIPVMVVIFGTFAGLIYTGWSSEVWNDSAVSFGTKLSHIIGASDSYLALLWSSISAVLVAAALSIGQRILSLKKTIDALVKGFKTMLTAILILILAWALADITKDLHTADFISKILIATEVPPQFLPSFTFILSALIAFSTGSSWGTMAILYPLILPASWALCHSAGLADAQSMDIFYITVSAILAGSVLGDHCSPISDTTILSSLASSCNHIEHVRTQLPYALTVGSVAILLGLIPAAYGVSSWILIPTGFLTLFLIVKFFGKK
ncbi:Na+/H+ antiporter NhaC family protein [Marinifilum caeruleilacunae]|uniref:Na+/H+ antiporter NhaC family protein n=1 Tax=Marinifilum caeruleilacunae TaxID=2499076 RepID=A0ABX1WWF5_9BACT|nr:Na+/H+ antiporter NhaC family protein [Marinifilum caeruleilacunae]NOU60233.1 Na+/H+ antiporter NhaC family protein [Marinifilum caeruleilacunae]